MPKICIPVVAFNNASVAEQAENIMRTPADLVEWRADLYGGGTGIEAQRSALNTLYRHLEKKPVIFTIRTSDEGGEWTGSPGEYAALVRMAVEHEAVSILDIEFSLDSEMRDELMSLVHRAGKKVILSFHDFKRTPSTEEMTGKLRAMKDCGADIAKIAVMPENASDVLRLMTAGEDFAEQDDAIPAIAISMGKLGTVSRTSGETFHSAVTFATAGRRSAPGQISADVADKILIDMHRSLTDDPRYNLKREGLKRGRNIVLIGFMGTGKSRISRILEQKCGLKAVEIDTEIEKAEGMKISEIFAEKGEKYFRDKESEVTAQVASRKNVVISCGGGTVMRRENVDALKKGGRIIMLRAKPETVYERVRHSRGKRPLLSKYMSRGYISWLMKQRDDTYRAAADFIVDVDGIDSDGAAELIRRNFSIGRKKRPVQRKASGSGRKSRNSGNYRGHRGPGKSRRSSRQHY